MRSWLRFQRLNRDALIERITWYDLCREIKQLIIVEATKTDSDRITCQWWNTDKQNACPCVWVLKSVSKPKLSIAGIKALIVYKGEPGTGASCVTCPLRLAKTVYTAETQSAGACTSTNKYGSINRGVAIRNAE